MVQKWILRSMTCKAFVVAIRCGLVRRGLCLVAAGCCLICKVSAAQQQQSGLPDAPSASAQSQTAQQGTNRLASGVGFVLLLDRKSLVFPDLATNKGPLTSWGKFKLAANNSVSLSTVGATLISAAYGQAIDSPSGYGQGGSGYAKRFGSGMARSASDNLFGTFLIASMLHEDPRFYVKRNLTFKQAVKYSAARVVLTRNDSAKLVVNYAGLLGPLAGEALANTYWPEQNRGVGSTFVRYASDLGWRFGGNLLRQYWPQINRKLRLAPLATEPEIPVSSKP
jgi:hypothetical protein